MPILARDFFRIAMEAAKVPKQMPIQIINGVECVDCPCCKARGYLVVWEYKTPISLSETHEYVCTHCMGKRYIAVEGPKHRLVSL